MRFPVLWFIGAMLFLASLIILFAQLFMEIL